MAKRTDNFWSHNRNYVLLYRYRAKYEYGFWYNRETKEFFYEVEGELWLIGDDRFFFAWKDFTHDAEIKPTEKSYKRSIQKWCRTTEHKGGNKE